MTARRVVVSLLFGGVISLVSYIGAVWYSDGIFVRWQALGSPPGGSDEMITGYMEEEREVAMSVIVATADQEFSAGRADGAASAGRTDGAGPGRGLASRRRPLAR